MGTRIADVFERTIGTSFFVPDYAALYAAAAIAALFLIMRTAEREGLDTARVFLASVVVIGAAFLSARLFVVVQYWSHYSAHPIELLRLWEGGTASTGAYAGGFLAALAASRWQGLQPGRFLDCCAPSAALAVAIGRLGCFMNGCCHGAVSGGPWSLTFPEGSGPYHSQLQAGLIGLHQLSLPVHPTQLYESALAFCIAALLVVARKYRRTYGEIFALFFILYPAARFLLEFLRGDTDRGFVGPFSVPQILAICAFVPSVLFLASTRMRGLPEDRLPAVGHSAAENTGSRSGIKSQ